MLKICYGAFIPTICLFLTPCLCVVRMTLLLLVIIMELFDPVFARKIFYSSLFLVACERLNGKGFLCSVNISLVCILDLMGSAVWFLTFFWNRHVFAEVTPFLLTLALLDIGNS